MVACNPVAPKLIVGGGAGALHHGKTADVDFDADFDVDVDVDGRVAEVARRHEGPPPKSLDLDENLSTFAEYLGKKSVFFFLGQKKGFLGKKCTITWYILHFSLS